MANHHPANQARRRLCANALRDMAQRLEDGRVLSPTMKSMVSEMIPGEKYVEDLLAGRTPDMSDFEEWEAIITVELPPDVISLDEVKNGQ